VDAARAEGLRVGFYYSLMDWHHPDGARCAQDEAARRCFVDYTHGLIREILTNYGKVDVLWYDVAWPLDAQGWESERMNAMVFQTAARHHCEQPQQAAGRLLHAGAEDCRRDERAGVGIVHDAER
jgi:alpha-L-fucosidase